MPRTARRSISAGVLASLLAAACARPIGPVHTPQAVTLPNRPDTIRFAVIGDSGEPGEALTATVELLVKYRALFPFEFVLMLGDNTYDADASMNVVFETPFRPLLDQKVAFFASLGNHDKNADVQTKFELFNMGGRHFYEFRKPSVRFFALDSSDPTKAEHVWIDENVSVPTDEWKIAFFHHPLYSSGLHAGQQKSLKEVWEPRFCEYGVDVVFSGHEHFYERIHPQGGIHYFVSGASSRLRVNDVSEQKHTAAFNDVDYSFMLIELANDELFYQTVTLTGAKIDQGVIRKPVQSDRRCDPIPPVSRDRNRRTLSAPVPRFSQSLQLGDRGFGSLCD